jgi:putative RNA 2'-phosphotransferase
MGVSRSDGAAEHGGDRRVERLGSAPVDRPAPERTRLSKVVSHALRHAPADYGLVLDDQGWVGLDDLVAALRARAWPDLTAADVLDMVGTAAKQRHEVVDGRIRARHGHSVPGRVDVPAARPPERLYHGTEERSVPLILAAGLDRRNRQYVHLTSVRDDAVAVARRWGRPFRVLTVRAAAAHAAGVVFREVGNGVWLTDRVPPEFLDPEPG